MRWLFGAKPTTPTGPATGLRVQSSVEGSPIPILLGGQQRLSGNILWYGDFSSVAVQSSSSGGKGGVGGGSGKGSQGTGTYNYFASFIMGLCEGPVASLVTLWNNKSVIDLANIPAGSIGADVVFFDGAYDQAAWGYMTTRHATEALAYRGIAYICAPSMALGDSQELPQLSAEVLSTNANAVAGLPDAEPWSCMLAFLTSDKFGVGYPSAKLSANTLYSNYCRALGLVVSPLVGASMSGQQMLVDLLKATNSEAFLDGTLLTIAPYGDQAVTGNGYTYTPDTEPEFDFTMDEFLPNQGGLGIGNGNSPVAISRKPQSQILNAVKVEYLDRTNQYNPAVIERRNEGTILLYGRYRPTDARAFHFFCDANAASMSAALQLVREQIPRTFQWTAGRRFIRLNPMDIVTLTEDAQQLSRQPVRIKEIQENQDRTLTFTAEDFPGTASAPRYGKQAPTGHIANYNVAPGDLNAPIFFEPTDELGGGCTIWAALSGVDTSAWGGCDVYASYDGDTYQFIGTQLGPARMGVLTTALPSIAENPTGQTIDTTNTLAVDLSESGAALSSGTQQDATSLNTACYVDGEILAYQAAALTATSKYNLSYLVRGTYATEDAMGSAHAIGSAFARLDQGIFKVPFDQSRIGATIYLKFAGFNIWGGGRQTLDEVPAHTYVIQGTALASPLPPVTNLRTVFVDGCTNLAWDEVADFRTVRYEIRLGPTADSALALGTVAHPPFVIPGNGTYWVAAISEPVAGLTVYSSAWVDVVVTGAALVNNVVVSWDEKTTGWTGTFGGGAGVDGTAIRTGAGDILTLADFLNTASILDYGGQVNGSYTIPTAHIVNVGYVAPCLISVKYQPTGVPVGQDILSTPDVLGMPDFLGAASTRFINVRPQIQVAQTANSDLYTSGDLYGEPDLYAGAVAWGDWQDFTPGVYLGQFFNFRLLLETVDPNTICYDLEFSFTVDVPDRIDSNGIVSASLTSLTNLLLGTGGTTITFVANTGTTAEPFNGGPGGTTAPNIQVTIRDAVAGDDVVLSSVSLSGCTIQVKNGGSGVARHVDVRPQGY